MADEAVFQISLKGFALSDAQKNAISQALQSAAMAEIAKLDFRQAVELTKIGGGGHTPGMVALAKSSA